MNQFPCRPLFLLFAVLACSLLSSGAAGDAAASSAVVAELFTSQGCSSCPPAERLISTWGKAAFERGNLIPLCFHVDYWDKLGWKDPFSSHAFTLRQYDYASFFKNASVYTPQLVVGGRTAFVGSNSDRANQELSRLQNQSSPAEIKIVSSWKKRSLEIQISVNRPGSGEIKPRDYQIMLALFENGLVTQILSGENAGLKIQVDFVVREFKRLGMFNPASGKNFSQKTNLSWNSSWNKTMSGIAVFLQDAEDLSIPAAEKAYPLTEGP